MNQKHNWQEWIDQIAKEDVSEEELRAFQDALNESPENQEAYAQALLAETALEIEHYNAAEHVSKNKIVSINWKKWALPLVAGVAVISSLTYFTGRQSAANQFAKAAQSTQSLASVTDTNKVADAAGIRIGQLLAKGDFHIPEGARIGIAMRGGARLRINGPTDLRFDNEEQVFLYSGRVQTYAPEYAHGFTIDTTDGKIIDLGTKFVTAKGADKGTEIHVIEGLVKALADSNDDSPVLIRGQEAKSLTSGKFGDLEYLAKRLNIPLNPDLADLDGDQISDVVERYYKTDPKDPESKPDLVQISDSFAGYQQGELKSTAYLGKGKIAQWQGYGSFLKDGLSYQNLLTSGGCIQTTGHPGEGATILLNSKQFPKDGCIYISFLMQQPKHLKSNNFSGLLLYNNTFEEKLFVGDLAVSSKYGSRFASSAKQNSFTTPSDDQTHLFVIKIDLTRQVTDIYIDPQLGKPESASVYQERYQDVVTFDSIQLRSGYNFPVKFDEIRLGLTWEAVLPTM